MSVLSTSVTPPARASIAENEHGLPVRVREHVANHKSPVVRAAHAASPRPTARASSRPCRRPSSRARAGGLVALGRDDEDVAGRRPPPSSDAAAGGEDRCGVRWWPPPLGGVVTSCEATATGATSCVGRCPSVAVMNEEHRHRRPSAERRRRARRAADRDHRRRCARRLGKRGDAAAVFLAAFTKFAVGKLKAPLSELCCARSTTGARAGRALDVGGRSTDARRRRAQPRRRRAGGRLRCCSAARRPSTRSRRAGARASPAARPTRSADPSPAANGRDAAAPGRRLPVECSRGAACRRSSRARSRCDGGARAQFSARNCARRCCSALPGINSGARAAARRNRVPPLDGRGASSRGLQGNSPAPPCNSRSIRRSFAA